MEHLERLAELPFRCQDGVILWIRSTTLYDTCKLYQARLENPALYEMWKHNPEPLPWNSDLVRDGLNLLRAYLYRGVSVDDIPLASLRDPEMWLLWAYLRVVGLDSLEFLGFIQEHIFASLEDKVDLTLELLTSMTQAGLSSRAHKHWLELCCQGIHNTYRRWEDGFSDDDTYKAQARSCWDRVTDPDHRLRLVLPVNSEHPFIQELVRLRAPLWA